MHYVIQPSDSFAGKGFRQDTSMIRALLSKGASMTVKDKKGVSPLDLAKGSRALLEIFSPKAQRPFPLAKSTYVPMAEKPYTADADEYLAIQMERIKAEKMAVDP